MSNPKWYKSRLKSWSKPKIVKKETCQDCGVPMTITPAGLICYYCKMYEDG